MFGNKEKTYFGVRSNYRNKSKGIFCCMYLTFLKYTNMTRNMNKNEAMVIQIIQFLKCFFI